MFTIVTGDMEHAKNIGVNHVMAESPPAARPVHHPAVKPLVSEFLHREYQDLKDLPEIKGSPESKWLLIDKQVLSVISSSQRPGSTAKLAT